ncbi:MAG TPA: tetratricopeptide repeat protein [Gemmatimonadales bacterium]
MKKKLALAVAAFVVAACGSEERRAAVAAEAPTTETSVVPSPTPVIVGPVSFEDAEATFRDKRYDEAVSKFTAYAETKPENPWGFYMLGLSAWKSGDHELAESSFLKTIGLDSTHVKSRVNLGRVLMETNRYADAVPHIQAAIDIDSTSSEGFRLLGRAYDGLGRVVDAIWALKRAIVLDGRDVWALNNLGTVLLRAGRYEDALGPLARTVELEPGVATFQNNFGLALERTGYYKTAAEAYRAALAVDSTYGKAAISLTRVEQLPEASTLPPLDLTAVVQRFVEQVDVWRSEQEEDPVH